MLFFTSCEKLMRFLLSFSISDASYLDYFAFGFFHGFIPGFFFRWRRNNELDGLVFFYCCYSVFHGFPLFSVFHEPRFQLRKVVSLICYPLGKLCRLWLCFLRPSVSPLPYYRVVAFVFLPGSCNLKAQFFD